MRKIKHRTAISYDGRFFLTAAKAAEHITEHLADELAQPKYKDAFPRSSWDFDLFHKNKNRIYDRGYPRVLAACKNMLA